MELKLKTKEIRKLMGIESPKFPKYTTQILNLANQNSQATRPPTVGKMSELIKEFKGRTIKDWEEWYLEKHSNAIENATNKILNMINNLKHAINKIDGEMVQKWSYDLIIVKTYIGLKFQEAVLKKISEKFNTTYKLANPKEESKGIDGYIGEIPVSLKPSSYTSKKMLSEQIEVCIIYYQKTNDGLKITIPEYLVAKFKE